MAGVVAKRYAYALFELARDQGIVEVIDEQAAVLEAVFADKQIEAFFASQRIGAAEKKQVMGRQFSPRFHPLLLNLLKLLIDKRVTPVGRRLRRPGRSGYLDPSFGELKYRPDIKWSLSKEMVTHTPSGSSVYSA